MNDIPEEKARVPPDHPQAGSLAEADVQCVALEDDGIIPNSRLPLLVYAGAIRFPGRDAASTVESIFNVNQWRAAWRYGVFSYHHYHSTAHETLGVYRGTATLQFGGDRGVTIEVHPGDVVVIPAGVAHKNLGSSTDFHVVGAYPIGRHCDMRHAEPDDRPEADENIAGVPLPDADPVYGPTGPLMRRWTPA